MENKPLFSILIANYNNGMYLLEAINSVRKQTYENWEIVIVDDGSSDNSALIYEELKHENRIRIFYNSKNAGIGYTKRRLCELAKGEIVGFLDADDALVSSALEEVLEEYESNEYVMVYTNKFHCNESLRKCQPSNYHIQIPLGKTYLDFSLGRISHFVSFKMKYYRMTDGINPYFLLGEDQDLYFKLEEIGPIKYLDRPLYLYRSNPKSITNKNDFETITWGLLAKFDACKRRGLNPSNYISDIIKGERKLIDFYESSNDYRIGRIILRPFRMIKKLFL